MKLIQDQLKRLEAIDVEPTARPDLDAFWADAMQKVKTTPLNVSLRPVDYGMSGIEVFDAAYDGLDGTRIAAWVVAPKGASPQSPTPLAVCYHGLGGDRGQPHYYLQLVSLGLTVVATDFRLQKGITGHAGALQTHTGHLAHSIMNIENKHDYYYYHAWTDAFRGIDLALGLPHIDRARVAVVGGSQGGGMALAAAALHPVVSLCLADVPTFCWLEKRVFDKSGGFGAIQDYLRDNPNNLDLVCETLSYYDMINLAPRITCPVLVSVGLKDPICPPDNVYAAYNKIRSDKRIVAYPFGDHGGGGATHEAVKFQYLRERFRL